MENAILGAGRYGTKIDGCPGAFTKSSGSHGRVAYAFGVNGTTGAQMSLIVASDLYGAAVYLVPAIAPALQLLHRYGVIGGPPRMSVNPGDLYLVDTPVGTAVLIRTEVTGSDPQGQAAPYLVLPPAVATLWLESMRSFGSWLWPTTTYRDRDHIDFQLVVSTVTNNVKYTIDYDTRTAKASSGARRITDGALISPDEVQGLWSASDNGGGEASDG